jgi:STE24 endopeptidase
MATLSEVRMTRKTSVRWMAAFLLLGVIAAASSDAAGETETPTPQDRGDQSVSSPRMSPHANSSATAVIVPPPSEKALQYYYTGNAIWVASTLLGLLIPAFWLFTGLSARLRTLAQQIGRRWFFTIVIYYVLFTLIMALVLLPWHYYAGFARPHYYGLSNQTLAKWAGDLAKHLAISLITGSLLLWVPYGLLARSPRRWWLYTGLLVPPLLFLVMLIVPIWIDPLFNQYGRMKNRQLEARILTLADRAGIEHGRVFEVNKSVDTKAVNAYVTGFLGTKRVVLWDTLLNKLEPDEVVFVMAHEMGHYVMHHVVYGILMGSAATMLGLYLVHLLSGWCMRRFGPRFGFERLSDVASFPLLTLLLSLVSLGVQPLGLAYSRHIEHEADRFAVELTHDPHAGAAAFVKLQQENLSNPRPGLLFTIMRSSHPSIGQRVDYLNSWQSPAAEASARGTD